MCAHTLSVNYKRLCWLVMFRIGKRHRLLKNGKKQKEEREREKQASKEDAILDEKVVTLLQKSNSFSLVFSFSLFLNTISPIYLFYLFLSFFLSFSLSLSLSLSPIYLLYLSLSFSLLLVRCQISMAST